MLLDDGPRVHSHHLVIGEGLADHLQRLGVVVWLVVGRHDDCPVDNQEIGISGWQAIPLLVEDGIGHRQAQQSVGHFGLAIDGLEVGLHGLQVGILRIGLIVATHIEQRMAWRTTHERVI